jgi:hypothetical protein
LSEDKFPSVLDIVVVILLLIVALNNLWLPAVQGLFQQGNSSVTNIEQYSLPVATIEIVLDTPPTQDVTINGYHAVHKFHDGEGYHLVFIVPVNKTYILNPSCCTRTRYLSPRKHYAFWLGGCVAIRTDK